MVIPNENLSISGGAIYPFTMPSGKSDLRELKKFCKKEGVDIDKPWKRLSKKNQDDIWYGKDDWYGVEGVFEYLRGEKI